jgi:hypothetical protein
MGRGQQNEDFGLVQPLLLLDIRDKQVQVFLNGLTMLMALFIITFLEFLAGRFCICRDVLELLAQSFTKAIP